MFFHSCCSLVNQRYQNLNTAFNCYPTLLYCHLWFIIMGDLYQSDICPIMETLYYLLLADNEMLAKVKLLSLT